MALKVGSGVERLHLLAHGNECALGVGAGNADEILRHREREWPQKNAVDKTEDGGVCADAESKRENRNGGEPGIFAQHAHAVPQILQQRFHDVGTTGFAALLLGPVDSTKFQSRTTHRFLARDAGAD